ncbi:tRNA(Ile)-lysidine synthetase [Anaplasma phagocytophilum str. CR1007]|nr:tRNA lysidine(34) synthetase TilS [Anaplasma phagocytophilum]EPR97400.1 tRNA(Ile)-lysidine synthetase [Anaplasma phagocytophilum str. HGE1]KJV98018.1 tRNA(Ile)-lysidine synthetase [Anaplasma phagocytophilum str. Annie]KJZ98980.1 tRNA(Ile)-lysidine synthetase [Anaplasma phagocytophilum str. CR1007]KKA00375.1 tRNA(Ile)-lysidine synthetase [Anaplasma phagocytophilum]
MSVGFESSSFRKLRDIVPNAQYAVAVSGGVDSMTLMRLVALFHKSSASVGSPTILTVNHGFRPEARNEVSFVHEQATMLGLECHMLHWENPIRKKSQVVARNIRYQLLLQWCSAHNVKVLLTAHTKNDQAETVLIRLERGSGIDGLAGIRERSVIGDVTIIRPLLDFTRREIQEYAIQHQQPWIEDPSNSDPKYRRTFYRNFINNCKHPEILISRLSSTALHMQRSLSCILHYVQNALDSCLEFTPFGYVVIKHDVFRNLQDEIASRLFLLLIMTIGNKPLKPRFSKFSSALSKVRSTAGFASFTLHGCMILKTCDSNIIVAREVSSIVPKTYLHGETRLLWDSRFELHIEFSDCFDTSLPSTSEMSEKQESTCGSVTERKAASAMQVSISPLDSNPIPEHLRGINKYVVQGLPVLICGDKVLAYPLQKHNINGVPVVSIERVLLKERMMNLICNQLDQ